MSVSVVDFVAMEVGWRMGMFGRGVLAASWHGAVISVVGMEVVIHVSVEVRRAMEPRASTDEDAARKPFGAVVAIGRAVIRSGVVVAVRTVRGDTNVDADLSLQFGIDRSEAESGNDN